MCIEEPITEAIRLTPRVASIASPFRYAREQLPCGLFAACWRCAAGIFKSAHSSLARTLMRIGRS